jgi:hypothetical protein
MIYSFRSPEHDGGEDDPKHRADGDGDPKASNEFGSGLQFHFVSPGYLYRDSGIK